MIEAARVRGDDRAEARDRIVRAARLLGRRGEVDVERRRERAQSSE